MKFQPILIVSILLEAISGADAATACPSHPPIPLVQGQSFYKEESRSVIDPSALRNHLDLIKELRAFVSTVTVQIDIGSEPGATCAGLLLETWARGAALLTQPKNFSGIRERERFVISLNIATLKLKNAGYPTSRAITPWLVAVNRAVASDFRQRQMIDNLYTWSGVAAASLILIHRDVALSAYADEVWRRSLNAIRPDGLLNAELLRGRRALLYHQYALSALLLLNALREAGGNLGKPEDREALQRLANLVAGSLCDAKPMAELSGVEQERPPKSDFRILSVFGSKIADTRFQSCGESNPGNQDAVLGGRLDRTIAILQRLKDYGVVPPVN